MSERVLRMSIWQPTEAQMADDQRKTRNSGLKSVQSEFRVIFLGTIRKSVGFRALCDRVF